MLPASIRLLRMLMLLSAATCAIGCGEKGPELYPVKGEVFVQGKPAVGAMVILRPKTPPTEDNVLSKAGFPRARVDENGAFEMSTLANSDGAPPGEYGVLITWFPPPAEDDGDGDAGPLSHIDRLGGRYGDPERPQFQATVAKEPTVIPKIELR